MEKTTKNTHFFDFLWVRTKNTEDKIVKKQNFFGKNTQDKIKYVLYNVYAKME